MEKIMLNIRTLILSVMLVFMLIFVVGKAVARTVATHPSDSLNVFSNEETEQLKCASLPSRYSIHTVYMEETGMLVARLKSKST
jgi:hypothetical protein